MADNGGLVAAGGGSALTVGVRPSQNLVFSPLATSTDACRNWTPGLLDADLADTPGAIAVSPSGRLLALLQDGTIEAAATAPAAAGGEWTPVTTLNALKASAAGHGCGLVGVTAVSFGPNESVIAAGSCTRPGAVGVFSDACGAWRAAGPGLTVPPPGSRSGRSGWPRAAAWPCWPPGAAPAAWRDGTRWTVLAPVAAGSVRALGFGGGGSAWLLTGGGRAEHRRGRRLAAAVVAPARGYPGTRACGYPGTGAGGAATPAFGGTGGWYQALAVYWTRLSVWRLAGRSWVRSQQIMVPIQYGSLG